jgi:predicted AlkP superfamily phosphohydrolase/phosphomutase
MKLIILGIDGLSHKVIEKCQDAMPTLYQHFKNDTQSVLKTTFPYFTGPAWTSFQTGKDTGNHGVNNYFKYDKDFNIRMVNGNDIKEKTFYEIVDENGLKCFTMNLPYTNPAKTKGDIVYSWLYAANEDNKLFFPRNLPERFPSLKQYRNHTERAKGTMKYLDSTYECLLTEEKVIQEVITKDEHDVAFFLICALDRVQHKTYPDLIAQIDNSKTKMSKKIFKKLDDIIKWIDENKKEETKVIIMSDHGFRAYDGKFYVNSWLKNKGHLITSPGGQIINEVTSDNTKNKKKKRKLNITPLVVFVKKHPRLFKFAEHFYDVIVKNIPFDIVKQQGIDFSKTKAYCRSSFESTIFLNENLSIEEKKKLKIEIIDGLNKLEDIEAHDCQGFYHGKYVNQIGDVVVSSEKYEIDSTIGNQEFISMTRLMHDLYGSFICYGPDIKTNYVLEKSHITDMTPTILHLLDLKVPNDLDGKVLKEIFAEGTDPAINEVKYSKVENINSNDNKEKIKNIIKQIKIPLKNK